ncbi:MAG TPA: hypothetical protein VEA69_13510 [Tepidisphaeraceae bacterium]|nr:hypothetical protein [Tepidisphaeraceae bacterium]
MAGIPLGQFEEMPDWFGWACCCAGILIPVGVLLMIDRFGGRARRSRREARGFDVLPPRLDDDDDARG